LVFTILHLNTNLDQYLQGADQAAGQYAALDSGINALPDGFGKLSGGFDGIKKGNEAVYSGIGDINKGLSDINTAAAQVPDQVQKLADGQKSMKDGVDTAIAEIKELTGTQNSQGAGQTVSFAAPGRITPNSVQFVLRTAAIEKVTVQEDNSEIKEEKESFWDRLIKLF
jgi:uncharacterized phage infection (PIP) family protein YhgE